MANPTIHIVSHTHWDREWYFSTSDSLVLMDQTITSILKELQQNPQVNFCLDGQISIVEEYLRLHPEQKACMQTLIDEKRLFVGPWYTQTDTQLVSMTSMINNLYYGIYDSKQLFDTYMNIGYLPDTFGFSNQIPMLLKQFEMDDFIFWRGIDYAKQNISPYFIWEGQDGSRVTTANLPGGYAMAQGLHADSVFMDNIYKPMLKQYESLSNASDILVTVGGDQHTIVPNLDKEVQALDSNAKISSYEAFMKAIKGQEQGVYCGEFREGRYARVHKSAGSIRSSIKKSNYDAEQSLIKGLEPLNVMAHIEGFGVSANLIGDAWKLLFEGQAHDGIVGCVSDPVAEDVLNRNKRALEISKSAQNFIKKQFAQSIGLQEDEVLIFNTQLHEFHGYKTIEIITHEEAIALDGVEACSIIETKKQKGCPNALVETPNGKFYVREEDYYIHKLIVKVTLPPFGYQVCKFHKVDIITKDTPDQHIENKNYRIAFNNHLVSLYQEDQCIENFISLCDIGNAGDTYDFSPLVDDQEFELYMKEAQVYVDGTTQSMKIDASAKLPYALDDRKHLMHTQVCPCTITLTLLDDDMIYVRVQFDNQVLSHRIRLKVNGLKKEKQTMAATPGGYVVRDVYPDEVDSNWNKTHVEYPIDIETNSGFVGFHGAGKQLVVFNKGSSEYQARDSALYMTLFASCGELGKPDLLYRPGRASGDTTKKGHIRMYTPLAQELHEHDCEFAITFVEPHAQALYLKLEQFTSANIFYQLQDINLFYERIDNKIKVNIETTSLPRKASYGALPQNLIVYSIYHSVYDDCACIRFMSMNDTTKKEMKLDPNVKISNLLEHGDYEEIKAYRMYTMRGNLHEHK